MQNRTGSEWQKCGGEKISVGCDGTFPLQDKGIGCALLRRFSISANA